MSSSSERIVVIVFVALYALGIIATGLLGSYGMIRSFRLGAILIGFSVATFFGVGFYSLQQKKSSSQQSRRLPASFRSVKEKTPPRFPLDDSGVLVEQPLAAIPFSSGAGQGQASNLNWPSLGPLCLSRNLPPIHGGVLQRLSSALSNSSGINQSNFSGGAHAIASMSALTSQPEQNSSFSLASIPEEVTSQASGRAGEEILTHSVESSTVMVTLSSPQQMALNPDKELWRCPKNDEDSPSIEKYGDKISSAIDEYMEQLKSRICAHLSKNGYSEYCAVISDVVDDRRIGSLTTSPNKLLKVKLLTCINKINITIPFLINADDGLIAELTNEKVLSKIFSAIKVCPSEQQEFERIQKLIGSEESWIAKDIEDRYQDIELGLIAKVKSKGYKPPICMMLKVIDCAEDLDDDDGFRGIIIQVSESSRDLCTIKIPCVFEGENNPVVALSNAKVLKELEKALAQLPAH